MSKVLSSWSGMRKFLEQDMLSPCLHGRIRYGFQALLENYPPEKRTEYTDAEFCEALKTYRSQSISENLICDNPIVRMFAVLDRRVGKRTLDKLKGSIDEQPEWLRFFYLLRSEAEHE